MKVFLSVCRCGQLRCLCVSLYALRQLHWSKNISVKDCNEQHQLTQFLSHVSSAMLMADTDIAVLSSSAVELYHVPHIWECRTIRSSALSFPGAKSPQMELSFPWNFCSMEHSLLGTSAPVELSFLRSERSKNFHSFRANIPRTFAPVVKNTK